MSVTKDDPLFKKFLKAVETTDLEAVTQIVQNDSIKKQLRNIHNNIRLLVSFYKTINYYDSEDEGSLPPLDWDQKKITMFKVIVEAGWRPTANITKSAPQKYPDIMNELICRRHVDAEDPMRHPRHYKCIPCDELSETEKEIIRIVEAVDLERFQTNAAGWFLLIKKDEELENVPLLSQYKEWKSKKGIKDILDNVNKLPNNLVLLIASFAGGADTTPTHLERTKALISNQI